MAYVNDLIFQLLEPVASIIMENYPTSRCSLIHIMYGLQVISSTTYTFVVAIDLCFV